MTPSELSKPLRCLPGISAVSHRDISGSDKMAFGGIWRNVSKHLYCTAYSKAIHTGIISTNCLSAIGGTSRFKKSYPAQFIFQFRTYKVRSALKLLCSSCRFVKRKGRLRVVCLKKPRHKQRQG